MRTFTSILLLLTLAACGGEDEEPKEELGADPECIRVHPDSVSCGWPIYFKDGTRYDTLMDLSTRPVRNRSS